MLTLHIYHHIRNRYLKLIIIMSDDRKYWIVIFKDNCDPQKFHYNGSINV
jgi:hypothetical protein